MITLDRYRPTLLHIDYWHLRALRDAVDDFAKRYSEELRGAYVLDYGSSNGPYSKVLEAYGARVTLADIGPVSDGILEINASTGRVPLADGTVNVIVSTQVLEHVPEVMTYLAEARRLLRPNGLLFLTTHGTWYLHRLPTDMRRWTQDGLRYDVEKAGFSVVSVEPKIGILATATHARAVATRNFLQRTRLLAAMRVVTNLLFNLRMGLEEAITGPAGRQDLQQSLILIARAAAQSSANP